MALGVGRVFVAVRLAAASARTVTQRVGVGVASRPLGREVAQYCGGVIGTEQFLLRFLAVLQLRFCLLNVVATTSMRFRRFSVNNKICLNTS